MPTTPQGYPYPAPSDAPNLSQYYQNIASAVDQRTTTTVANATARTSLANKYDGMLVYQSDTQRYYKYDLGNTRWDYVSGPWFTWTPTLLDSASTTITAGTLTTSGLYVIRGGRISFDAIFRFQGAINGGVGNIRLVMPSGVVSATSEPEQHHINAELFTSVSNRDWMGGGWAYLNGTAVGILMPTSASDCSMQPFRNATGAGVTGSGVPLVPSSYPLGDGSRLHIWGEYSLSAQPAL